MTNKDVRPHQHIANTDGEGQTNGLEEFEDIPRDGTTAIKAYYIPRLAKAIF